MAVKDPRIDSYIKKSAPFAQPILKHLRQLVRQACPSVTETIKWGFPNFEYNSKILCSMAAFQKHCSFSFWNAAVLPDPNHILTTVGKTSMGHLGRITQLADLPKDQIVLNYLKTAMQLREQGSAVKKSKLIISKTLTIPKYFSDALSRNKRAKKTFQNFSYSHQKEYVEWLTEAKQAATREKRLCTALDWLGEGKTKNWKYER